MARNSSLSDPFSNLSAANDHSDALADSGKASMQSYARTPTLRPNVEKTEFSELILGNAPRHSITGQAGSDPPLEKPRDRKKMAAPTREEIEARMGEIAARLDATEARIGESLGRVEASINAIKQELDEKPGLVSLIVTVATGAASILGIGIAVLAFGGDRFDGGVQLSSISVQQAQDAKNIADQTARQVEELKRQNDLMLQLLQQDISTSGQP